MQLTQDLCIIYISTNYTLLHCLILWPFSWHVLHVGGLFFSFGISSIISASTSSYPPIACTSPTDKALSDTRAFLVLVLRTCIASLAFWRVVICACSRAVEAAITWAPLDSWLRASTIGVSELLWCLSSLCLIRVVCLSTSLVLLGVFAHHDS